ncbi:MAG: DUF5063 domain-containing protein [Bacteroidaceae bacterium]
METKIILEPSVAEFVTVAVEFCAFIEGIEEIDTRIFVDHTLKLLPLLYLKASTLPAVKTFDEDDEEGVLEQYVTEDVYNIIRMNIANVIERYDDYLEVFKEDMQYSDTPIKANISEDLSDIYQDLRNFLFIFQLGINETMTQSLIEIQHNFKHYWGQKVCNAMRALHDVMYTQMPTDQEDEMINNKEINE